jgi:cysteine desulfurase
MSFMATIDKKKKVALKEPTDKKVIYLDNHATTAVDPGVLEAMLPYFTENFGNPASTHFYGIKASYAVDKARSMVATAINASEDSEIIFTSGATESNNQVLKGVFDHYRNQKPHFIVSAIEHKCILEAAKHIQKLGAEITFLEVSPEGLVDPGALKKAIKPTTVLVSIMIANNEIGSLNPIKELVDICHSKNILFHSDAAQAIGKIPIDVNSLGVDLMSASGHKFYGPKGVGFLYAKKSAQEFLSPLLDGGGQESNLRSGTLNVPGIVGIGRAIELAVDNLEIDFWHCLELRNLLYEKLLTAIPSLILNGTQIDSVASLRQESDLFGSVLNLKRLPGNLNITVPEIGDSTLLRRRLSSLAFSAGSACSSASTEPSYVLTTIGRTSEEAAASLRFGIGRFNTLEEVETAADLLVDALTSFTK